jgi:hypothetical protein
MRLMRFSSAAVSFRFAFFFVWAVLEPGFLAAVFVVVCEVVLVVADCVWASESEDMSDKTTLKENLDRILTTSV